MYTVVLIIERINENLLYCIWKLRYFNNFLKIKVLHDALPMLLTVGLL